MIKPHEDFWKLFKNTKGAFSTAEAVALYNIVDSAKDGKFLELGTHKGKSALAIAWGIRSSCYSSLDLVEPEFSNTDWLKEVGKKVSDSTPYLKIKLIPNYSLNIIPDYDKLSFVFIDSGAHDDMVMDEVKALDDKMIDGGIIAFHDFKNQFTAVERAYNYLLSTGRYEEIKIDWDEIFAYVAENNLEEGNDSWHVYPELPHPPNFVGALRKKDDTRIY